MITLADLGVHLPPIGHTGRGYNAWLASQPCAVPGCGIRGVELHHAAVWPDLGRKANHLRRYTVITLCAAHHRHARYSVHSMIRPGGDHGADRTRREDQQLRFLGAPPAADIIRSQIRLYADALNLALPAPASARTLAEALHVLEVA